MAANITPKIEIEELIVGKPKIIISSPYNAEFVAELKAAVPYGDRRWDPNAKLWTVGIEYGDAVAALMQKHFGLFVDARQQSDDEQAEIEEQIEDAALEAEIEQIKANQAWIIQNEDDIRELIGKLSQRISRYSYTSKSSEKAAFASDRALLEHALDNARLPLEQLAEVQVRGMAAVVRRMQYRPNDRNSFWYRL